MDIDTINRLATSAMTDDSLLAFDVPGTRRRKMTTAFESGLTSPEGNQVLPRDHELPIELADLPADCLRHRPDPALMTHSLAEML